MTAPVDSGTRGAILLAGGRASRVDGATKPLFEVGGRTLLAVAVGAATDAGASPITVVGPLLDASLPVAWVREDPPFGGPAAAIVCAVRSWPADDAPAAAYVLACDLPGIRSAVRHLDAHLARHPEADGVCLADADGRPQWLIGLYRTRALRGAAAQIADGGRDRSVRELLAGLDVIAVTADDALTRDVDTWEDLEHARATAAHHPEEPR